jgi:hypothetical protein
MPYCMYICLCFRAISRILITRWLKTGSVKHSDDNGIQITQDWIFRVFTDAFNDVKQIFRNADFSTVCI